MEFLNQCVDNAVRTEAQIENVKVNIDNLKQILQIFIASGNLLDSIKKNVFYDKPINQEDWENNFEIINNSINLTDVNDKELVNINPRIFHSIVGIATEATELMEALYDVVANEKEIDNINVREEIFDALWYICLFHGAVDKDFAGTFNMGFDKLKKRYPDKFSAEHAINRDIESERKILESY